VRRYATAATRRREGRFADQTLDVVEQMIAEGGPAEKGSGS
jgi:hypothetical protein